MSLKAVKEAIELARSIKSPDDARFKKLDELKADMTYEEFKEYLKGAVVI